MSGQALIEALPPASDSVTYLTIIEYNLTKETLPTLVNVLQDEELTRNIGWDLINLLLPLLPDSRDALEVIVKLGNAREVVLKVTEALRLIDFEGEEDDGSEDNEASEKPATNEAPAIALSLLQMQTLLAILPSLHSRLKTKAPSRFLSTTLQAVLAALSASGALCAKVYSNVLDFTSMMLSTLDGDHETAAEKAMQQRLLQSFLTHAFEVYVLTSSVSEDDAAMRWSERVFERSLPTRIVPGKVIASESTATTNNHYEAEERTMALLATLNFNFGTLRAATAGHTVAANGALLEEEEPPERADDIPLSAAGSLFLLVSTMVKRSDVKTTSSIGVQTIFPYEADLLVRYIGSHELESVGSDPLCLVDAALALSLLAVVSKAIGSPNNDDEFTSYLQRTSLLSANTPLPHLRYVAHYITSAVLHAHPSNITRLQFIHDTLEHCPYENLKASAVEWFKDELLTANEILKQSSHDHQGVFTSSKGLRKIAPFLFPALQFHTSDAEIMETYMEFTMNLSFYLAALNLYYFLLASSNLFTALHLDDFHRDYNMADEYLLPLTRLVSQFPESLDADVLSDGLEEDQIMATRLDLALVDDALQRIAAKLAQHDLS